MALGASAPKCLGQAKGMGTFSDRRASKYVNAVRASSKEARDDD